MLRVIILSLVALAGLFLFVRACGLSPAQVEDRILLAELNTEEGAAYRAANGVRAGVVTLASGLQVEVLRPGDGEIPTDDDWVEVHYRGWHLDGREFENSWRRGSPATVPITKTIAGWRETLVSIPVGTRARLVVPPGLAYGRAGGGVIGPEETLVFELDLIAIVVPDAPPEFDPTQQPVPGLR